MLRHLLTAAALLIALAIPATANAASTHRLTFTAGSTAATHQTGLVDGTANIRLRVYVNGHEVEQPAVASDYTATFFGRGAVVRVTSSNRTAPLMVRSVSLRRPVRVTVTWAYVGR